MIVMALLEKICGNTFYMPGRANVGIFIGEKGRCTLIDAGLDDYVGKNVLRLAHQYDWQLEGIINTHGHADHCGGNSYLQNKTHVPVYATAPEAALMENPELEPYYLYSAAPIKELQIRFLKGLQLLHILPSYGFAICRSLGKGIAEIAQLIDEF
jgi:glyoxylase-like metal-dependent hydrolase (beta-lactamase superfamily II)